LKINDFSSDFSIVVQKIYLYEQVQINDSENYHYKNLNTDK